MKKLLFFLIVLIVGCAVGVKHPTPTISQDGKSATYEALELIEPVKISYMRVLSRTQTFLPAQKLKKYKDYYNWTLYRAEKAVPDNEHGCGIAINKSDSNSAFWWNASSPLGVLPHIKMHNLPELKVQPTVVTEQL